MLVAHPGRAGPGAVVGISAARRTPLVGSRVLGLPDACSLLPVVARLLGVGGYEGVLGCPSRRPSFFLRWLRGLRLGVAGSVFHRRISSRIGVVVAEKTCS